MEELPLEPEFPGTSVDGVARHRQVDRRQVDADLMRAAGLEPDPQQGVATQQLIDLEVRQRVARRVGVERLAIVPRRDRGRPTTSARYSRVISRART